MKKVEFLIVGQGLAGTLLAFEMFQAGLDFKIVSSAKKSKASLVAAGMTNPLVFRRMTKSWMVDELLPVMKTIYRNLEGLLSASFYFEKNILKPLSELEMELWLERKKNPEFDDYVDDILDKAPNKYLADASGYGIVNGSGYLNMVHFLSCSQTFFKEKGLLLESEIALENKETSFSSFPVENILAEKIVFCEGYHLMHNSIFDFVKMKPVKGEVLEIYSPELSEEYILNKKCFVLPIGNQRFKVGSTYEWKDLSEQTTEAGSNSIRERLESLVSVDYKIEKHSAGVRPSVIDRRPVLGQHPKHKNISIFNGFGTKGVMLAPYFAKEMLNFIADTNHSLSPEINVQRFI